MASSKQPPFVQKHLIVIAVAEGLALAGAAVRLSLSNGAISLDKPAHLAWFLTTVMIAALSMVQFTLRSVLLRQRDLRGEDTTDVRKGVLATSVAMAFGALVLAVIGPMPFERLMAG